MSLAGTASEGDVDGVPPVLAEPLVCAAGKDRTAVDGSDRAPVFMVLT